MFEKASAFPVSIISVCLFNKVFPGKFRTGTSDIYLIQYCTMLHAWSLAK